jgi:hypothetical protein
VGFKKDGKNCRIKAANKTAPIMMNGKGILKKYIPTNAAPAIK